MGVKCFVPGCSSGYTTDVVRRRAMGLDKISLFQCPRNPDLAGKWQDAIGRMDRAIYFGMHNFVCELHFSEKNIIRYDEVTQEDGSVELVKRQRARLTKDAVPCYSIPGCVSKAEVAEETIFLGAPVTPQPLIVKIEVTSDDEDGADSLSAIEQFMDIFPQVELTEDGYLVEMSGDSHESNDPQTMGLSVRKNQSVVMQSVDRKPIGRPRTVVRKTQKSGDRKSIANNGNIRLLSDIETTASAPWHSQPFSIELLTENIDKIELPSDFWSVSGVKSVSTETPTVLCTKWDASFMPERRVIVDCFLNVKVYLKHHEILRSIDFNIKLSSFEDLCSLIEKVDMYILCVGVDDVSINRDCLIYIEKSRTGPTSKYCASCRQMKKQGHKKPVKSAEDWKKSLMSANNLLRNKINAAERKNTRLKQKVQRLRHQHEDMRKRLRVAKKELEVQERFFWDSDG